MQDATRAEYGHQLLLRWTGGFICAGLSNVLCGSVDLLARETTQGGLGRASPTMERRLLLFHRHGLCKELAHPVLWFNYAGLA